MEIILVCATVVTSCYALYVAYTIYAARKSREAYEATLRKASPSRTTAEKPITAWAKPGRGTKWQVNTRRGHGIRYQAEFRYRAER
ncbi:MAG: hypothetical protein AAFS10_18215 [Myxococcota bacterium]